MAIKKKKTTGAGISEADTGKNPPAEQGPDVGGTYNGIGGSADAGKAKFLHTCLSDMECGNGERCIDGMCRKE